ncbi:Heterokaryon incompatibility protein 6 like [Verticillium longisporum]|uniref:Heterokaryon incompatibility domain-containing protein n=2 Tax=Verticillium TaxID=1036719 RepID=G2XFM6_VERDV|nr:uncharacterized protein VDAG_09150 [Verticillium dahliae VdLs.17]EGY18624.1 hypothetical protein VDAG_09150 [Verticillium dahliae VdLs.17]KAG7130948.1 Heterokaryon incompatibility protein 6 like [Verticillium longisporum]
MSSIYEYAAITAPRTIRLMHVYLGDESDPINLSIVVTTLDAVPDFEAISYCWGDAQDRCQVTCDGATLFITNSLVTALVHFWLSDRPRVLWADAICINQGSVIEKNCQVLLMPNIYAQATRTLVWLGVANDPVYGYVSPTVATSIREALELDGSFEQSKNGFIVIYD